MKKFPLWLAGLASCALATTTSAVTVKLNGDSRNLSNITITHTSNGIEILSDDLRFADYTSNPKDPDPKDPDPKDPDPKDPDPKDPDPKDPDTNPSPGAGDCVESATQDCGPTINWGKPGGRISGTISGTTKVLSWKFTTTADPGFSGNVSVFEMTGSEQVNRRLWISETPSGEALSLYGCSAEGNGYLTIPWSQQANYLRCSLKPKSTYYLNVKNTYNCSANRSCGFYRSLRTSQ